VTERSRLFELLGTAATHDTVFVPVTVVAEFGTPCSGRYTKSRSNADPVSF